MATIIPFTIGKDAPVLNEDDIQFINATLNVEPLKEFLAPIIEIMAHTIEATYKSPSKFDYCSTTRPAASTIYDATQFDDICIKLLHVSSGQAFFLVVDSSLARNLLSRLVTSSLIEDAPGLLFSSTEKGIFSFIVARLIVELNRSLGSSMPSLKILGIFHSHEEAIKDFSLTTYIVHHFALNFLAERYSISLFISYSASIFSVPKQFDANLSLARCGHIDRNLRFIFYQLKMPYGLVFHLKEGDLILFDRNLIDYAEGALSGALEACWDEYFFQGMLFHKQGNYFFKFKELLGKESEAMKPLEIISSDYSDTDVQSPMTDTIKEIAKDLKVNLNIEISRIPMSLREIAKLQHGSVINLHQKIGDPLEMVIENKVIGHCMPVQIDGRLGIKVLSMEGQDPMDDNY